MSKLERLYDEKRKEITKLQAEIDKLQMETGQLERFLEIEPSDFEWRASNKFTVVTVAERDKLIEKCIEDMAISGEDWAHIATGNAFIFVSIEDGLLNVRDCITHREAHLRVD